MESAELLQILDEENVLQQNEAEEYELTDAATSVIQDERSDLEDYLDADRGYEFWGKQIEVTNGTIDYYANCEALDRYTSLDSIGDLARTAFMLSWFQTGMPKTEGCPDRFLPIHGNHLQVVEALFSPAIAYIWRSDCRPCDMIHDDLERLTADIPSDELGLFSIYGPEYSNHLHEVYNVVGGPTTLFIVNGSIDSRLQGAHEPQLLRREIETIRERHE